MSPSILNYLFARKNAIFAYIGIHTQSEKKRTNKK